MTTKELLASKNKKIGIVMCVYVKKGSASLISLTMMKLLR